MANGTVLTASWEYFHMVWCPLAGKITWSLQDGPEKPRALSYDEVKRLFPINTPKVGQWHRFGLLWVSALSSLSLLFDK